MKRIVSTVLVLLMLTAIPLSDTEREAILGGNIKRLLGLV